MNRHEANTLAHILTAHGARHEDDEETPSSERTLYMRKVKRGNSWVIFLWTNSDKPESIAFRGTRLSSVLEFNENMLDSLRMCRSYAAGLVEFDEMVMMGWALLGARCQFDQY